MHVIALVLYILYISLKFVVHLQISRGTLYVALLSDTSQSLFNCSWVPSVPETTQTDLTAGDFNNFKVWNNVFVILI